MSRPTDYYALLQVQPGADPEVIDAAYKALMKKVHPDRGRTMHGHRAAALTEARGVLLDPEKRAVYDSARNAITGKVIQGWRIERAIAEGGFGVTYLGRHRLTGEPVCIKHASQISPTDREILIGEAKAMWDLRHYAIPAVRDVLELEDGSLALVMSYVEGPTLMQLVEKLQAKGEKLDAEHVAWILDRIMNALSYIHRHGVVHGDIKPQNIIVQPDKHMAVLVDFGLSEVKPTATTRSKGYTTLFSPPEQEAGKPLIPQIDFYALGMTALYALNGGDIDLTAGRRLDSRTPEPMKAFLRRMLQRDPLARPDWQSEDLLASVAQMRQESFGRTASGMKKLAV